MDNLCAVCEKSHTQLLMLSCGHDPCIECASIHYMKQLKLQADFQLARNFTNIYPCEICFEITKMDPTSVQEIKSFADSGVNKTEEANKRRCKSNSYKVQCIKSRIMMDPKPKKSFTKKIKSPKESTTSSSQHLQLLNYIKTQQLKKEQPHETHKPKGIQKSQTTVFKQKTFPYFPQKVQFCHKHVDEFRTYYCFTCSSVICPECAIHGSHVGHDVQAIRKASSKLKSMFNQYVLDAQRSTTILSGLIKEINNAMDSFLDWNNRQRKILKERFKDLHELLKTQENKLINEINESEEKGLQSIRGEKEHLESTMVDLKEKRRKMKEMINEEVTLWDFKELKSRKEDIYVITEEIKLQLVKKTEKSELQHLKCDIVEEAIDTIEELVSTFRLSVRNKLLEGTATFEGPLA